MNLDSEDNWENWWEELLEAAKEYNDVRQQLIRNAPFVYEEYFEQGLLPTEALSMEWGV